MQHLAEGERLMTICNACRYCEGYCAVFPAMEKRLTFSPGDLHYLANLCHNCAECYYACQYAPPHEFAVNVPQVFAQDSRGFIPAIRVARAARETFRSGGKWIAWLVASSCCGCRLSHFSGAVFYDVIPHERMVAIFLVVALFILIAHIAGFLKFWTRYGRDARAIPPAARAVKSCPRRAGSGQSFERRSRMHVSDERHSQSRRIFHHFTFYGFMLCFASTTVAAIDHILGFIAPHPYISAPVILGTLGGAGLLIGPAGLYLLKRRRDPAIVEPGAGRQRQELSRAIVSYQPHGPGLLVLRETPAMGACSWFTWRSCCFCSSRCRTASSSTASTVRRPS